MNTPLTVILKRFEALSALAVQESEYSINLIIGPGQGLQYGTPDTTKLMVEPAPCEAALTAFLDALPTEVVYSLTALMYSGRDQKPNAVEYWKTLRTSIQDKDGAIEAITEKTPRIDYIKKGIELLLSPASLDDIPKQIASL